MTETELLDGIYKREGGFGVITDRPSDAGGLTHSGVIYAEFNRWRHQHGLPDLSTIEFVALQRSDLDVFLLDQFVTPFQFVTDDALRLVLADFATNAGPDDAIKAIQTGLRSLGAYTGAIDGGAGPQTRAAWADVKNLPDQIERLAGYVRDYRVTFYVHLALKDKDVQAFLATHPRTDLHNLEGWVSRALQVR